MLRVRLGQARHIGVDTSDHLQVGRVRHRRLEVILDSISEPGYSPLAAIQALCDEFICELDGSATVKSVRHFGHVNRLTSRQSPSITT